MLTAVKRPQRVRKSEQSFALGSSNREMKQDGIDDSPAKSRSHEMRNRKAAEGSSNDTDQIRATTMNKAEELERELRKTDQYPTLIRLMLPYAVTNSFQLCLPAKFCKQHMPLANARVRLRVLEGETESIVFGVNYLPLPRQYKFRGGWKAFAVAHMLEVGDVLVFQLVKPLNFKVYIVRANASKEVDVVVTNHGARPVVIQIEDPEDDDADGDEGFEDECGLGKRVKRVEDFTIKVNGSIINDELFYVVRSRYYQLCRSQNSSSLHHRAESHGAKLIAGMIIRTVHIVDAVGALSGCGQSGEEDLEAWRGDLEAFEKLGMDVEFLIEGLGKLAGLADKANEYEKLVKEN